MRTTIAAVTALAGSLLLAPLMLGPTQAGSAPDLKNAVSAIHDSALILVGHGGGGGGGGGGGRGGGGWGGGGHPSAMARGDGGGRGFAGPRMGGPWLAEGRNRGHFEHGDRGRFVERHDRGERFEHRRFAERGHDFDRFFHHRHRVFVNGIWVWAYGDDCWWLRRQALITGSPYWWSRYNLCVGYY
jgi:hypothetical protein